MPELFSILIKINIALMLFCAGYYMVLRKLTFYTLNRAYLVGAILLSSVYPFVDLTAFAQQHQQIVEPVQNVVIYWKAPVEKIAEQAAYWNWLEVIFWIGAAVFACRLALQMASLYKIYRRSTGAEINGQKVRVVSGDIGPFSFWQSIYINPENLSDTDIKNIVAHEQVHVKEWHTLDILLSEISVIFYWFNPGVWLMKRAVRENIEFLTDRKILQKGTDSKAYQYSLLSVTFNQPAPAITSNFNFSTLKKRIMMMNAKKSSNLNLTRYALLVPVVIVCLLTLTLAKAEAVKIGKAIKQIAVSVEDIGPIAFEADTTPVKKKQTKLVVDKRSKTTKQATAKAAAQQSATSKQEVVSNMFFRGVAPNDSIVIIVDNKVVNNISTLNPNDIKSITVIKNNPQDYIKKMTGITEQAEGKIKGVINVTTKGALEKAPVSNVKEIEVVGYGSNVTRLLDTTSKTRVRLREINGGAEAPLIVVDGETFEGTEDVLKKVPPEKIESMTVLKGATATTYYGEKAKNGAIIITTKK